MRRGQGQTEFILIVALVAIATIGVITLFGDHLRILFGNSSDTLAGDQTGGIATRATEEVTNKDLSNFAQSGAYDPASPEAEAGAPTSSD